MGAPRIWKKKKEPEQGKDGGQSRLNNWMLLAER